MRRNPPTATRLDVLLARPVDAGRPAAFFQLVLGLLIPWFAVSLALTTREWFIARLSADMIAWSPPPPLVRFAGFVDLRSALGGLACLVAAMLLSWAIVAWTHRPMRTTPRSFIRRWYRAMLVLLLLLPPAAMMEAARVGQGTMLPLELFLVGAWAILLPSLLHDTDCRPHRRSSWRPVCPECGYSVVGNVSGRCAECGNALPQHEATPRRWAIVRPPWERLARPALFTAYRQMLALLAFRPGRAGWQLGHEDRWGRAMRWAGVHVVLGALLATLVVHYNLPGQVAGVVLGNASPQSLIPAGLPGSQSGTTGLSGFGGGASPALGPPPVPLEWRLLWAAHTFVAWLAVLLFLPALAGVIGSSVLAGAPSARAGAMKLALYLTGLVPMLLFVGGVAVLLFATLGMSRPAWLPSPRPLATPSGLAVLFGVWWGVGAAWNPHLRRRGWFVAFGLMGLFMVGWLLCAHVLFDAGALETLL